MTRRVLGSASLVVAVFFLAWAFARTFDRIPFETFDLDAVALAGAFALVSLSGVIVTWAWMLLLDDDNHSIHWRAAARVMLASQLGKYVPGGIWQGASWIAMSARAGLPPRRSSTSFVVLMALDVASAVVVGSLMLFGSAAPGWTDLLIIFIPMALAGTHPTVLGPALRAGLRLIRRPADDVRLVPFSSTLRALSILTVKWVVLAFALLLFSVGLGMGTLADWRVVGGSFAIAWAVGFLVLIVPSGLGVREGALVVLLADRFGEPSALAFAIATRLLFVLSDAALAACGLWVSRSHQDP